jgi:hypothetical protein
MYWHSIIAAGLIALAAGPCQAEQPPVNPPKFKLAVSPPFSTSGKGERFRAGDITTNSPPYRFITTAALTRQFGRFDPPAEKQSESHGWSVTVYATFSKKVADAYASTKDGYQLGITGGTELEIPDWGSYMVARLRRKQFSWGKAVSFLSQFTQDSSLESPVSGRLDYNVWGVTADRKYTVVARIFSVRHPKLPYEKGDRERSRDYRTIEALKRDPDYKLIERCKPEEFTPSLTAFDEMLDSLTIR